jgi:tetratricopeptide (TPR) repeat protein
MCLFFCCTLPLSFSAWPKTPQEIFEAVAASIVVVQTFDASRQVIAFGSGVVISSGEIVTNCHVVEQGTFVRVKQGEKTYQASMHYSNTDYDLCHFTVRGLNAPPVSFGSVAALKAGARVVAIGAPQGLELSISEGLVSSLREHESGAKIIQTSAPISPGSSGGGLFNDRGQLVGITTLFLKDSQNLNFAVPVDWIKDLPNSNARNNSQDSSANLTVEKKRVINELKALAERLRANDPNFDAKIKYFAPILEKIFESGVPPSKWVKAFEKAYWELTSGVASLYLDGADKLLKANDWVGLVNYANDWVRTEPDNEIAWFYAGIGRSGLSERNTDSASFAYQKAQTTNDYKLKEMLLNERDLQRSNAKSENLQAINAFQQAVRLDSTFAIAWFHLGSSFMRDKNLIGANSAYKELKKLDSELAEKLNTVIKLN